MPEQSSSGGGPGGDFGHVDLHLERAHSARMYDFYLGGKSNYAADREAAAQALAALPGGAAPAVENRAFMHRVTRVLAERGIRQWLDVGTGIPTPPNLHEVAQQVAPEARVVYVDNDPIVLAHAQALLASTPEGETSYIQADITDPEAILGSPELARTLDLGQPVVLSLMAVLQFVPDEYDPYGIVSRLLSALPSGSALALSQPTPDFAPEAWAAVTKAYTDAGTKVQLRSRAEIERFFTGLELLDPGITVAHRWRPDPPKGPARVPTDADVSILAGAAIKP